MSHTTFDGHIIIDGQFVSERIHRIVASIKDYDERLNVQWVPPAAREKGVAAFKVSYDEPGQPSFVLFHVNTEEEFDERVLMRIIQNDQRHNPQGNSELEAFEKTQELINKQLYEEMMEERADIAFRVLNSPLNTYKVDKDLVFRSDMPFNASPEELRRRGLT